MTERIVDLAIILVLIGTPLVWLYQIFFAIVKFFLADWWNKNLFFITPDPLYANILEKNFRFYQQLNHRNRKRFVRRVQKFIQMKEFETREDLYLTVEMEVLVAAVAIQITFGHPSVYFRNFRKIILYPDVFYSINNDSLHRGEVNPRGVIVLSWKHFMEGYTNEHDGRNLGLHEMAHVLRVTDYMKGDEYGFLDDQWLQKFTYYAEEEMQRMANGENGFFREYAATDKHEFFAVAIENFFERPTVFQQRHPELFDTMTALLNQNPIHMDLVR